jgi:hypothetical protein
VTTAAPAANLSSATLRDRIEAIVGPRGYLHKPEDLTLYEYDGGQDKARPDLVVFPETTGSNWAFRSSAAARAPGSPAARSRARAASSSPSRA